MSSSLSDRTLALAGVVQAVHLVQQLARRGTLNDSLAMEACINSVFNRDAESAAAVYGGISGVASGLKLLRAQLIMQSAGRDLELTKYAMGALYLERQLSKRPAMLERIAEGIEQARGQVNYFSSTHPTVIANLASIYTDTISMLTPRIMINGDHNYLSNADNANKIRALLLAAIRSAVLWQQKGGGRFQLLFARKATLHCIEELLHAL